MHSRQMSCDCEQASSFNRDRAEGVRNRCDLLPTKAQYGRSWTSSGGCLGIVGVARTYCPLSDRFIRMA